MDNFNIQLEQFQKKCILDLKITVEYLKPIRPFSCRTADMAYHMKPNLDKSDTPYNIE